jgi:hypothetical protein
MRASGGYRLKQSSVTLFKNHGDFHIRVEGRIIHSEVTGTWSIEAAQDYMRQLDRVVEQQMAGQPWGSVVMCRGSILFPLDMIAPLRERIAMWVSRFRQAAVATVVGPEVEGYGLLYPTLRSIYAGLIPFDIFDTTEAAIAWMRPLLNDAS